MTIEQIVMYKTSDGKTFHTEAQANEWENRSSKIEILANEMYLSDAGDYLTTSDMETAAAFFVDNYNFERKTK